MKKTLLLALLIALCSIAHQVLGQGVVVYVVGSYMDGATERGALWRNGQLTSFNNTTRLSEVAVERGRVYVGGRGQERGQIFYYANGVRRNVILQIPSTSPSDMFDWNLNGMVVLNGRVHKSTHAVASRGYSRFYSSRMYIDGLRQEGNANAGRMIVDNGILYSTFTTNPTRTNHRTTAGYRALGQSVTLATPSGGQGSLRAYGITVSPEGNVLVVGSYRNERGNWFPALWVDGRLFSSDFPGRVVDVAYRRRGSPGSGLYVIGNQGSGSNTTPFLWWNGTLISIPGAARFNRIVAFEDKVYITGTFRHGQLEIASYWIVSGGPGNWNVERVNLPGGRTALGIAVVRE